MPGSRYRPHTAANIRPATITGVTMLFGKTLCSRPEGSPSVRGKQLLSAFPGSAAPAGLPEQAHRPNLDSAFDALHHVIKRERSDRRRGHRLHLHSGAAGG